MENLADKILVTKYHHIDNGGIKYNLGVTEDYSQLQKENVVLRSPFMTLSCSYYGYPEIETKFSGWEGHLNSSFFRQMGLDLIKFADKLDQLGCKP